LLLPLVAASSRATWWVLRLRIGRHMVAVVQQMVGSDGCAHIGGRFIDELHGIRGSDVFEHHFQRRKTFDDTTHVLVDKNLFAVEYVDVAAGHFAVDEQRQAYLGHRLEHREYLVDAGHARIGISSGACRVQLGGVDETTGLRGANFFGLRQVGEVEHHQRLETAALRARGEDSLTIGVCLLCIAYRRHEVRHDDRAAKSARYVGDGVGQNSAISKMDVPVVGAQEGQAFGHWGFQAGQTRWECYRKRLLQALAIKFCGKLPIATCKS
jgi:hypothetical protein